MTSPKDMGFDVVSGPKPQGINPKDAIANKKVPLGLLPAVGIIHGAAAMEFGAFRAGKDGKGYGPYNWRTTNVRLTVYLDALERHILALRDGEDVAGDSGVHHLGHIIAGASIALDALELGRLVDDRPPKGPAATVFERLTKERKAA